ncbi:hypothetical protein K501DRAFT_279325 [Backusella circina FSU 941]|nr:hypothetical protein K501DRAFT_279325 [Backusella circina FSU 941]
MTNQQSLSNTLEVFTMELDCLREYIDKQQRYLHRLEKELDNLKQDIPSDYERTIQVLLLEKEELQEEISIIEQTVIKKLEKVEDLVIGALLIKKYCILQKQCNGLYLGKYSGISFYRI